MAKGENTDVLLDANGDEMIANGDFVIGDGREDDGVIIMKLNSGALKQDPFLGPNLISKINSKTSLSDIKQAIGLHLRRDGKEPVSIEIVNGVLKVKIE